MEVKFSFIIDYGLLQIFVEGCGPPSCSEMACGTDDLSEILKVLKINHEENNVDKECLRSLVNMYSGQDHRVELVLEELEQLLGKKMQRSNKDLKQGYGTL